MPYRAHTLSIILAAAALTGCMAMPADPAKMTAEQIKASAGDRSAQAACTIVNSPWGVGRTIFVQLDQRTIPAGSVTVGTDCAVTIQSEAATKGKAAAP